VAPWFTGDRDELDIGTPSVADRSCHGVPVSTRLALLRRHRADRLGEFSILAIRRATVRTGPMIVTALSLALGGVYAVHVGQDVNWDWQNYHDYDVLALLHDRHSIDVAPAGTQSFLNPIPYVPYYLLRHHLPPIITGAIVGAIQSLNFIIAWALTRRLMPNLSWVPTAAAMLISASGAMTLSEIGTSFADLLTAIPVLIGLLFLVTSSPQQKRVILMGGLFIGSAVGLKLTNAIFAVGALAMIFAGNRPLRSAIWFGLGSAIGFVITGGAWSFYLWHEFGNPLFPFYNNVFRSPAGPSWNITDPRYYPHGLIDALSYPFRWIRSGQTTNEVPFRDARFAVIIILAGIAASLTAVGSRWTLSRRESQFLIFFVVSLVTWMVMFSVQRYLVVLEILAGPLIVLLLHQAIPAIGRDVLAGVIAITLALWVQPSDWWHRPWTDAYVGSPGTAETATPATYFLVERPLAFVIHYLPATSRFYQLADHDLPILPGTPFDKRIRAGLAEPLPGGNWVMHIKGRQIPTNLVQRYNLEVDYSYPCITLAGAVFVDVEVCRLRDSQEYGRRDRP
jgi:hypothetical protein